MSDRARVRALLDLGLLTLESRVPGPERATFSGRLGRDGVARARQLHERAREVVEGRPPPPPLYATEDH